jgi:hypothetical protein
MTECTEIADNMAKAAPHFATPADALAWVKQQMPDETFTVRENVARSLYERQISTPTPLSARLATMAEQLRGFISPSDLSSADRAELSALASALTAASQDAARLDEIMLKLTDWAGMAKRMEIDSHEAWRALSNARRQTGAERGALLAMAERTLHHRRERSDEHSAQPEPDTSGEWVALMAAGSGLPKPPWVA